MPSNGEGPATIGLNNHVVPEAAKPLSGISLRGLR